MVSSNDYGTRQLDSCIINIVSIQICLLLFIEGVDDNLGNVGPDDFDDALSLDESSEVVLVSEEENPPAVGQ